MNQRSALNEKDVGLLTHGVSAGSSSSSNPLLESSAEEERLRSAPLPGSVRGQRAIRGTRFRPYSHRKAPGHFSVDTSRLGVERQRRRNERLLRRESAAQGGYAADSDDSLGTTDRSCRGATPDPEVGSGEGEEVPDHSRASSIDGGARSVEPVVELPPHAFCSFVAGRRYSDRGPTVLDGWGVAFSRDGRGQRLDGPRCGGRCGCGRGLEGPSKTVTILSVGDSRLKKIL